MGYRLPAYIPAPLPRREEDATQQDVLVIEPTLAFARWIEIKQMMPVMDVPLLQCAWCGLILTGKWQDAAVLHLTKEGPRPYLLPNYSHGLCSSCKDEIYAQWCQSRAMKKTKQPYHKNEQQGENSFGKPLFTGSEEQVREVFCLETTCV